MVESMEGIKRQIESLVELMHQWADWQRGYSGVRGYGSRTPGLSSGHASKSFEDLCVASDTEVALVIDRAVDELPPGQGAAIRRRYGISAVFRFPHGNYEELLLQGHCTLLVTLPKKGVVI